MRVRGGDPAELTASMPDHAEHGGGRAATHIGPEGDRDALTKQPAHVEHAWAEHAVGDRAVRDHRPALHKQATLIRPEIDAVCEHQACERGPSSPKASYTEAYVGWAG